ncbi:MAG: NAD-dependent epimerase/dehydratase family protein [Anaerolineales bacterium]|nr:NAD-dependent epimerase/dehydratase family protein [Anaerolineales bacterium]
MRVIVLGGSGHIGTYLIPRLVNAGHEVINISRGQTKPYIPNGAWNRVQAIHLDREQEDAKGTLGEQVRALQGDVVIDLICYTPESAQQIVDALRGEVRLFMHCGTMWVHGYNTEVPATEEQPRRPFHRYTVEDPSKVDPYLVSDYGVQKAAIEAYLLTEAQRNGFPATVLHPGHVVGVGHWPVNPAGNFNPEVFRKLATGQTLTLPNFGLETVHHVHGDDVAQAFMQALANWSQCIGESFHVVSPAALTLRGYAEAVASWFGQPARLEFMGWEQWRTTVSEGEALATWDHIAHSPNGSIEKARRLLNYNPRYSSLEAISEALTWMIEHGKLG